VNHTLIVLKSSSRISSDFLANFDSSAFIASFSEAIFYCLKNTNE
jgi:hypothetical protein